MKTNFAPAVLASLLALPGFAIADTGVDTSAFEDAVTIEAVRAHQAALQAAADANGGTREATSSGYDASVDYVTTTLEAAGYEVELQYFDYVVYRLFGPGALEQTAPVLQAYAYNVEYSDMSYSAGADVTAPVTAVDLALGDGNTSTSGCEASDFVGFPAGHIALIQRGACNFSVKAENAAAAGAVGAIVFNQGNTAGSDRQDLFFGTLGEEFSEDIPVVSMPYALGVALTQVEGLEMRVFVDASRENSESLNVIAETAGGRSDRVVLVGAHLDSVDEGPGIQDNGSGSAAILETAVALANSGIKVRNKVRFAWWGAEESGLVGSYHYAGQLSARDIKNIALNLNFDMVGSPNGVRFIYDGDGSATGASGPNGSGRIEDVFLEYFDGKGLPTLPTAFDGRSDYGPFIEIGIPAGGLFTGAEEIKTEEEAAIYGGTAGASYDPCYHLACDTYDNVDESLLDEMSDAIAHSVLTFAMTTSAVNGTSKASDTASAQKVDFDYLGTRLKR